LAAVHWNRVVLLIIGRVDAKGLAHDSYAKESMMEHRVWCLPVTFSLAMLLCACGVFQGMGDPGESQPVWVKNNTGVRVSLVADGGPQRVKKYERQVEPGETVRDDCLVPPSVTARQRTVKADDEQDNLVFCVVHTCDVSAATPSPVTIEVISGELDCSK
jgi:hypothetical protein